MGLTELKTKIRREYEVYKKDLLKQNSCELVWDSCIRIAFYCCVSEYFEYSESITEGFINTLESLTYPIYAMWEVYLKDENLQFARWEDIEGILLIMSDNRMKK